MPAVFLDRDGTINDKVATGQYVVSAAELRLLPGASGAIRRLNDAGLRVVVVTNQRGVARGHMTMPDVDAVHQALTKELETVGARIDAIYVCPHDECSCQCRKPLPGLLLQAAAEHPGLDLAQSVMVGDSESDVECAHAAGARAVLIGPPGTASSADVVCSDLASAVDHVIATFLSGPSLQPGDRVV